MFVQIFSRTGGCYTVGHYEPDGTWIPHSDYATSDLADEKVRQLNGGSVPDPPETVNPVLAALARFLHPVSAATLPPHEGLVWAMFACASLSNSPNCTVKVAAGEADDLFDLYRARVQEGKFNG